MSCILFIYFLIIHKVKIFFFIQINDRRILDGILITAGCSKSQLQSVCSIIDRLDKITWNGVEKLLLGIGVNEATVGNIKHFMFLKGQF